MTATSPTRSSPGRRGPFRKLTRARPWLGAGGDAAGPGGQEFFTDGAGNLHVAYHGWTRGSVGYGVGGARSLRIARVEFAGRYPVVVRPH